MLRFIKVWMVGLLVSVASVCLKLAVRLIGTMEIIVECDNEEIQ